MGIAAVLWNEGFIEVVLVKSAGGMIDEFIEGSGGNAVLLGFQLTVSCKKEVTICSDLAEVVQAK